jgi:hypothetical protein
MRYPVVARKDQRIEPPIRASALDNWAAETLIFSTSDAHTLVTIARLLCPHDWLEDVIYRTVVLAIDRSGAADTPFKNLLEGGIAEIRDQGFDTASKSERIGILKSIETTQFFRALLRLTIHHLYDDPIVWAGCGYEGVHGCSDAGTRAGINDLDWLPEMEIVTPEKALT